MSTGQTGLSMPLWLSRALELPSKVGGSQADLMQGVLFPWATCPRDQTQDQVHRKLSHEWPPWLLSAQRNAEKLITASKSPHHKSTSIYYPRKEME